NLIVALIVLFGLPLLTVPALAAQTVGDVPSVTGLASTGLPQDMLIFDRHGNLLADVGDQGDHRIVVPISFISPNIINATIAIEAAARSYFRTNAHDLSLAQASMLAGLPQAPTQYNPLINLPAAKKRQHDVLAAMVEYHFITAQEADAAFAVKLQIYPPINQFAAPYFVDYVLKTLRQQYHIQPSDRRGYRIY